MSDALTRLADQYTCTLRDYLEEEGEAVLQRAYELGRTALADGLGVLEMAALHHEAMARIVPASPEEIRRTVRSSRNFFVESLSPFEMVHRGFQEANTALRRLNEILEEEARRVAHAIHDEAGQLLASVHLALEEAAQELPHPAGERLNRVRELLALAEQELRRLSHELRPTILDDLGLFSALEFLADRVSRRTGLSVVVEGSVAERPSPVVETALYRIAQEALTNATKHSQATRVKIRLVQQGRMLHCSIRDDGVGFDTDAVLHERGKHGLGLIGIRERLNALGGNLQIVSARGQGTELNSTIPLEA